MDVSIIIPVLNQIAFTRQCLDRIWRNSGDRVSYEVIVVDNASSDSTQEWLTTTEFPRPLRYVRNEQNLGYAKANNIGARLSRAEYLLFLNNDTLVQPGWLDEMLRVARSDKTIGVVGIKQLFPYTNTIYHVGIVFAAGGIPQHLHPHVDASLPYVNKQREYQAVTGACLMIERALFEACNGFDEAYVNGYEDVDLCMQVRERRRKIVCCTSAYIYHYGQISEGRTAADDRNAARFAARWSGKIRIDQDQYLARDRWRARPASRSVPIKRLADDCIYLADPLDQGSALTWVNAELALALKDQGVPVFIHGAPISSSLSAPTRNRLEPLAMRGSFAGGVQIKWSHYWPQHLNLELTGDLNLEFFVINYLFGSRTSDAWDEWLQCVRQNQNDKLPLSEFCRSVLLQLDVADHRCHVIHPGYSREIDQVEPPRRDDSSFRLLSVTNSHDLNRYGTASLIEAYDRAFRAGDEVTLIIKDYGAAAGNSIIRDLLAGRAGGARIVYVTQFTDKRELIRLYKSADAFVSAHRGEGFAMKMLDAMACGLPVITPLFGGPTAYCTVDNCLPVEFSLVPMGDCLDTRSLAIGNQPRWAEPDIESLAQQMRTAYEQREAAAAIGARGRASVVGRFSWDQTAQRLIAITTQLRARRVTPPRAQPESPAPASERSPYWLGLRVSVVVPTHNRKDKLLRSLDALARQSILPKEFEVIVVDDGSTDGTGDAVAAADFPFAMSYYRQDNAGPGAARNLGIARAAGEFVLFIGDDILADPRLLEEHLLAHAADPAPGLAILGHIDWPDTMPRNAVMDYVCGDAALQFGYNLIPTMRFLDHPFFYTSNISVRRTFLVDAANAGIRFDPDFHRAAFEDSEFALRLMARGLVIRYRAQARAFHDHPMDLDSFAAREFAAGEMAVVFYRKHPVQEGLDVRWLAGLNDQVEALRAQPDVLRHLTAFDSQSDTMFRALAGSLEELQAIAPRTGGDAPSPMPAASLQPALENMFRVIFDVQRTRGKVREWFANVDDAEKIRVAQTLASARRKMQSLNLDAAQPGLLAPLDADAARLRGRIGALDGGNASRLRGRSRRLLGGMLRMVGTHPAVLPRLRAADRFLHERLQSHPTSLSYYRRARRRVRSMFG